MEEQARQGAEYERKLEAQGVEAYVATGAEGRRRPHDFRPESGKEPQEPKANWLRAMAKKLDGDEGRAKYKLRRRTVEPVFGIVKSVPGFRRFSLRGMEKVRGEWNLVTLADNCKRLHKLQLNHAVWRVRSDRIRPARDWTTAPEARGGRCGAIDRLGTEWPAAPTRGLLPRGGRVENASEWFLGRVVVLSPTGC